MAKSLNFGNVKKQYLTVTLADENNTTLMIGTPKKGVMTELLLLKDSLESIQEGDDNAAEAMDDLYGACAKIMSCNKGGVQITKEMLEDDFDLEDILIFFNAYMGFVDEISKSKNLNSPTIR